MKLTTYLLRRLRLPLLLRLRRRVPRLRCLLRLGHRLRLPLRLLLWLPSNLRAESTFGTSGGWLAAVSKSSWITSIDAAPGGGCTPPDVVAVLRCTNIERRGGLRAPPLPAEVLPVVYYNRNDVMCVPKAAAMTAIRLWF